MIDAAKEPELSAATTQVMTPGHSGAQPPRSERGGGHVARGRSMRGWGMMLTTE